MSAIATSLHLHCLECDTFGDIETVDHEDGFGSKPLHSKDFTVIWAAKGREDEPPRPLGAECKKCGSRLVKIS